MSNSDRYAVPTLVPASLAHLSRRSHVRVVVPRALPVFARLRAGLRGGSGCRGVVLDASAGGLATQIIEGGRIDLPAEGQEVKVDLDFEGSEAHVIGRAVRVRAQEVSLAFAPALDDDSQNVDYLELVGRLVTRRIELLDRRRLGEALVGRLRHQHFTADGTLDVRVHTAAPSWWQLVFLEYLVSWSEARGLETGVIDRSFSAERATDPLAAGPAVTRHAQPWRSLRRLGLRLAAQCHAALPAHGESFALIERTIVAGT
jgi:hypothetical protein